MGLPATPNLNEYIVQVYLRTVANTAAEYGRFPYPGRAISVFCALGGGTIDAETVITVQIDGVVVATQAMPNGSGEGFVFEIPLGVDVSGDSYIRINPDGAGTVAAKLACTTVVRR